jgi:hypothetical protein
MLSSQFCYYLGSNIDALNAYPTSLDELTFISCSFTLILFTVRTLKVNYGINMAYLVSLITQFSLNGSSSTPINSIWTLTIKSLQLTYELNSQNRSNNRPNNKIYNNHTYLHNLDTNQLDQIESTYLAFQTPHSSKSEIPL